ncbi:MAG TPA: IS110 family transposase [Nocardioidaceae bacterium]
MVIAVDPAKRSHTLEVLDAKERVLATLRVENTTAGYRQLREFARRWPARRWAIEGARGTGRQLAQRLVADGERVIDVPAKLSTRVRVLDTGHGRKNDPADAHAVGVAALRHRELTEITVDDETVALRLLSDRRRELVHSRTQTVNRIHQLLMELIPSGAPRRLSATKAKQLVATVKPRDVAGRTRRAMVVDLIDDVCRLDRKIKAVTKQITEAVDSTGTRLTDIVGIGPVLAAVILGEVGDISRFPTRHHFASFTGTAPLEASSGDVIRHRLNRLGNRQLNHALHTAAVVHIRYDSRGRAYYERKKAAGKGSLGALRCLKRRLSDAVYRALTADQTAVSPGGQVGASLQSSAADQIPTVSTSEQPLSGLTSDLTPVAVAVS